MLHEPPMQHAKWIVCGEEILFHCIFAPQVSYQLLMKFQIDLKPFDQIQAIQLQNVTCNHFGVCNLLANGDQHVINDQYFLVILISSIALIKFGNCFKVVNHICGFKLITQSKIALSFDDEYKKCYFIRFFFVKSPKMGIRIQILGKTPNKMENGT